LKPIAALLLACILLAASPARAEDRARSGGLDISDLFQRGRIEINAGGGYGLYNNTSYLILALGGGYYVLDGLSLGMTGETWVGATPQIFDVSPAARYVFLDSPWTYKPFVGAFYRRTGYSARYSPVDSLGARAGLVFPLTRRAYLTGDLAYEHYFACSSNINTQCDSVYPEVGLEFSF
jgi:hypothetical protein